ncbi:MAG: hypothetical protein MJ245_02445 [Clostridia bacterium]|nr:hypothetical protein [Clostridia bacterium]
MLNKKDKAKFITRISIYVVILITLFVVFINFLICLKNSSTKPEVNTKELFSYEEEYKKDINAILNNDIETKVKKKADEIVISYTTGNHKVVSHFDSDYNFKYHNFYGSDLADLEGKVKVVIMVSSVVFSIILGILGYFMLVNCEKKYKAYLKNSSDS